MSVSVGILPYLFLSICISFLCESFTSAIFLIPKRGFLCLFCNMSLNLTLYVTCIILQCVDDQRDAQFL